MGETVSGRLPEELVEDLDELGRATGQTRSEVLRDVIRQGLSEVRLQRGLDAYRAGQASIGRASEIAGRPITGFLDELRRANVPLRYGPDELAEDLAWADQA